MPLVETEQEDTIMQKTQATHKRSKDWDFWHWLAEGYQTKRFEERTFAGFIRFMKRFVVIVFVFLVVPVIIYCVVTWEPGIGASERGSLGMFIITGLCWITAYLSFKRHESKKRLVQLLDKLFGGSEEAAEHLFKTAKHHRETLRNGGSYLVTLEGEDRVKWLGIR